MAPFEIKYLAISWAGPDEVSKLGVSNDSVLLQHNRGWFAETTTFPAFYHYIGIQITAAELLHVPYFVMANGEQQPLVPVKVPGEDQIWWIQSEGWDESSCRHLSSLYRTSGRVTLVAQREIITLENNAVNFTFAELEYYLNDFKDSLWMLILDTGSVVQANLQKETPNYVDPQVVRVFQKFIESVETLIKKPAMVLEETIAKRPLRKVRPLPRTFREIAIIPNARSLTSRANIESYNTAENRFVCHCVKRVQYVLRTLQRIAQGQINAYQQSLEQEQLWLNNLSTDGTKVIDPAVYDFEIEELQRRLEKLQSEVFRLVNDSNGYALTERTYFGSYTVELSKKYGNATRTFFATKLDGVFFKAKYKTYLVITFPEHTDLSILPLLYSAYEIKLTGHYIKKKKTNASDVTYFEIIFNTINDVEINSPELIRMRRKRSQLEQANWVAPLSKEEIDDIAWEKLRAERKAAVFHSIIEKARSFLKQAAGLQARLQGLSNFFELRKVKAQSNFPNSMVFIQNSHYASAKTQYSKLSNLNGLDELTLNSLMQIESMGLVNISNLYEKWCLIKIIDVLVSKLRFSITDGWQEKLIQRALNKEKDIAFELTDPFRQFRLLLTYEKTLASGNRPDFVLELEINKYEKSPEHETPLKWIITGTEKRSLVLDAKFRGNINQEHIDKLVSKLYYDKDYSEDENNQVFVLHPCANLIANKSSPLDWGKHCDYGQSQGAKHRYGSVFLSPSLTYSRSVENLERLLGMFIQGNSVILEQSDSKHPSWHNISCISCGCSTADVLNVMLEPTKKGRDRWIIECSACSSRTIKTLCIGCGKSLFKNGPKWTYHKTRAEQISNIVCPECEQYLTPYYNENMQ